MSYLPIFPTSPLPADLLREPMWGENVARFDSGQRQASSPFVKPLYKFTLNLSNIPISKASSLMAFYHGLKGMVSPFLISDPYDQFVNGVVCVNTGTHPSSFFVVATTAWKVIPVSGNCLITSAKSGALVNGTHYQIDGSTGIVQPILLPSSVDYWTASCQFFKKAAFEQTYGEQSVIWNQFSGQLVFEEIAL